MSDKILQIKDEENGTDQQLHVKYLSEIITARLREIIDALLFKIQESGYADRLRNGVVLTGGCANLAGCSILIKEMSGYNVRTGYPRIKNFSVSGCPGICETSAAASVGMLLKVRNDVRLNCTDTVPVVKTQAQAAEEEGEEPVNPDGDLFRADEWEVREPEKKPKKPKDKEGFLVRWIKDGNCMVKKIGEEFVGSLYDKMEEN